MTSAINAKHQRQMIGSLRYGRKNQNYPDIVPPLEEAEVENVHAAQLPILDF